jgi:hypothetical protein
MAHDRSAPDGSRHQAAVLLPPAPPSERHVNRGPLNHHVTGRDRPSRRPSDRTSASRASIAVAVGAGLIGPACAVHFPRSDPGDPKVRAFRAPDWTVAIPDMGGRAGKGLAGSDDRGGKKRKHGPTLERASEPENPADDIERPLLEAAPAGIGRVVAQHRARLPCGSRATRLTLSMSSIRRT